MLITILAIMTAVLYLFRLPKIRHWNIVAAYLICLFCAWVGLVLAPQAFSPRVAQISGAFLIVLSLVVLIFDFLIEIVKKLIYAVLSKFRPLPPLPPHLIEVCRAVETLANAKTGALLILEKKNKLASHVSGGMSFDAEIKAEVLIALFGVDSPVHDGAIILSNSRITRVKTILPLATRTPLPLGIGTRHRSAIGITERTDAIALVVSEERGEVSVAYKGKIVKAEAQAEFVRLLKAALRGREIREENFVSREA